VLAHGFLREGVGGAGINLPSLRREPGGAILHVAIVEMQTEISAGKIRQDGVRARLPPAGFPAALKLQVGESVAGALRFLPDAAGEAGDQFRVRAVTEFPDRFPFCFREFHAHVELAKNREWERQNHHVRLRFGGGVVGSQRQFESAAVAGDRLQARSEFCRLLQSFRQPRGHAVVSFGDVKSLIARAENAKLVWRRFVAHGQQQVERALLVDLQTVLADVGGPEHRGRQAGDAAFLEPFGNAQPIHLARVRSLIADLALDFHRLQVRRDGPGDRSKLVDEFRVSPEPLVVEKISVLAARISPAQVV